MSERQSARRGPEEAKSVSQFLATSMGQAEPRLFRDLAEAAADPDAALVISGDWRGTIYLTVPARLLRCDWQAVEVLTSDFDAVRWMGAPFVAEAELESHPVGSGVVGGMGGGIVIDGVWTHPTMFDDSIRSQAEEVVAGNRARIDLALLRNLRASELEKKRTRRMAAWKRKPPRNPLAWDFDISEPRFPLDA